MTRLGYNQMHANGAYIEPASDLPAENVIESVAQLCSNHTSEVLLTSVYWHPDPSVGAKLSQIADSLEDADPVFWVTLVRTKKLSPIQQIILLNCLIRKCKRPDQWVHHAITQQLRLLQTAGIAESHLPLALHSFIIIDSFGQNEGVRSSGHTALSASLARIAPRIAVKHALQAGLCGNPRVFLHNHDALQLLDISPPADRLDLASAIRINKAICSPLSIGGKMTRSDELDTATHITIEQPKEIVRARPYGDASHYLFTNAGRPTFRPELSVITVEDAMFLADISRPGLPQFYTSSRGRLVSDLSFGMKPFTTPNSIESTLPLFVLEDSFSSKSNISHFVLDHIPRLLAYRQIESKRAAVLLCEPLSYYREVLRDLGVVDIIEPPGRIFSIAAPLMFFTSTMFQSFDHPANLGSERTVAALRRAFRISDSTRPSRRLAISRADAPGRKLTNSKEVEKFLTEVGFEIVTLSGTTFAHQKDLFQAASHVVGVHGAGLTNILFSPKACRVFEIIPPFVAAHSYWALASAAGQPYFAFNADDPELPTPDYANWKHNPGYNRRDVTVSLPRLTRAFEAFLSE